ncbi:YbaN family protein [Vagococcus fluvialis]|uniref:YbaN family protein n=1 Tax=Vagococcus fluvialis TaxID=2738 RepID=UPI000A330195|nr:YbaN family protein [Vagococcus fluvialis]MBO0420037.1 YbaN family protein [Vagococcus fluvialis]MBO0427654.1 YbaN family protein [Vagococcus fluvialis]MBO0442038.1 YbaN family protein [Vagococcus fluvialis]
MKKSLFIILGGISFILGTLGLSLPFIPTVPFYMLTSFLWLRSSEKLYNKFVQSTYYQKYIQELIIEKKMTTKGLVKLFTMIFIVFLIPGILVDNLVMRISLVVVYVLHLIFLTLYFKKKERKNMSVRVEE